MTDETLLAQLFKAGRRVELPLSPNVLVGRATEIAQITALILNDGARIVTITGSGGVGKTRLAIEVARGLQSDFVGGAGFVDLAPVSDPYRILAAVAGSLGIEPLDGIALKEQLLTVLGREPAVLVLDNVEHLLPGARAISELADSCPELRIILTSREPLRIRGEREFLVNPLSLPRRGEADLETLLASDAVKLFVDRATAIRPGVVFDDSAVGAIGEICVRLDGLPLAIEIAASRTSVLPAEAIASRLGSRFSLLSSTQRDAPGRQRTLFDTIGWSYELLDDDEQMVFRHLGVFHAGASALAVEAIERERLRGLEVLGILASLESKHLVYQRVGSDEHPRFLMLESIREFAWHQLGANDELDALQQLHSDWFHALASDVFDAIYLNPVKISWLDRAEDEIENLRAALGWLAEKPDPRPWIEMVVWLAPFWFFRSHRLEGEQWIRDALARAQAEIYDPELLGWVHHALGLVLERKPGAVKHLERSIEIWEPAGLSVEVATSRISLSIEKTALGEFEAARELGHLAIPEFERARKLEFLADQHEIIGRAEMGLGNLGMARHHAMISLAINVQTDDDWSLAGSLTAHAFIAICEKDWVLAAEHLDSAREHLQRVKSLERLIGWTRGAAVVHAGMGSASQSAFLFGAAEQMSRTTGFRMGRPEDDIAEAYLDVVQQALGEARFLGDFHAGAAARFDDVLDGAVSLDRAASADEVLPELRPSGLKLTPREIEVLGLMVSGCSDQEIADELFVTRATARRHIANLYRKLNVSNRSAAVVYALSHKLVDERVLSPEKI